MLALLRAELVKMRKSGILFVILAVLFVVFPSASIRLPFVEQAGYSAWLGPAVMWRSFAAPFAVNVIFTLPTILAVNSSRVGPYCPWAQPFNLMYPVVEPGDVFVVPPGQALAVVGGSLAVFFLAGFLAFLRKAF
jgi:hypothetical protein